MKKLLQLVLYAMPNLAGLSAFSQGVNIPSPNAASLARYGEIPVNLAYGIPDISIPLEEIKYKDISVPMILSYHASGIGIDDLPGWNGLGWSLQAGGQITRVMHDGPDDYHHPTYTNFDGYYFRSWRLNTPLWDFPLEMKEIVPPANTGQSATSMDDSEPDEFLFSMGNISGKFIRSEKGTWEVKSTSNVKFEIQEELNSQDFILHGYEGNGYVVLKKLFTKFTITDPSGYKYIFGGDENSIEFSRGASQITDGIYSIYVTPNSWYLTKIISPTGTEVNFEYEKGPAIFKKFTFFNYFYASYTMDGGGECSDDGSSGHAGIVTNPVYLSKIETPVQRIELQNGGSSQLQYPNYTGETLSGELNHTMANWPDLSGYVLADMAEQNTNHPNTLYTKFPTWYFKKLNYIKVFDKTSNQQTKKINFDYSNDFNVRLTLLGLEINEGTTTGQGQQYSFEYDNVSSMPGYRSMKSDFWGNYNGQNYSLSGNIGVFPDWRPVDPTLCKYGSLKKIVYPTGGLTEFEFEANTYSKSVKSAVDGSSLSLSTNSGNQSLLSGGLRIKKITNTANYGTLPVVKEYKYVNGYTNNGTVSSGILNNNIKTIDAIVYTNSCDNLPLPPPFNMSGSILLKQGSDNSMHPVSVIGGPSVLYSEVTEKIADGSFVVHKFTNFDDPANMDELNPNHYFAPIITVQNSYALSSLELERGLKVSQQSYDANAHLLNEHFYKYNQDPLRKNNFIKALRSVEAKPQCDNCVNNNIIRTWPYKIYFYPNYLVEEKEKKYEDGAVVESSKQYKYDAFGNIVEQSTYASDGRRFTDFIRYCSDQAYQETTAANTIAAGVQNLYKYFRIKNYPIEKTTVLGSSGVNFPIGDEKMIKGELFLYSQHSPTVTKMYSLELQSPFTAYSGTVSNLDYSKIDLSGNLQFDSRYKLQYEISNYANQNRQCMQQMQMKEQSIAYTWDYNGQYCTSISTNSNGSNVAFTSFENGTGYTALNIGDDNKGNWEFDKTKIIANAFTGYKSIQLTATDYVSSTFNLVNGQKYTLTYWCKGGTPKIKVGNTVMNVSFAAAKTVGDWSFYVISLTGTNEAVSLWGATGPGIQTTQLDELALRPESVLLKSYNYDPATGNLISIGDEKSEFSFFKYDLLGRLIQATDENGNILKNITYQIQGAQ